MEDGALALLQGETSVGSGENSVLQVLLAVILKLPALPAWGLVHSHERYRVPVA